MKARHHIEEVWLWTGISRGYLHLPLVHKYEVLVCFLEYIIAHRENFISFSALLLLASTIADIKKVTCYLLQVLLVESIANSTMLSCYIV